MKKSLENFNGIAGISEIIQSSTVIKNGFRSDSARVFGVRLEDRVMVADLPNQLILGDLKEFQQKSNSVLIGSKLAKRLQTSVGKTISLSNDSNERKYNVAGVYEEARSLLEKPFGESIFQLSISNPDNAPNIAAQIETTLGHHASHLAGARKGMAGCIQSA